MNFIAPSFFVALNYMKKKENQNKKYWPHTGTRDSTVCRQPKVVT